MARKNGKGLGEKGIPIAVIMKTYLDCIPCFFRQALAAAKMSSTEETIHRRVLNSVAFLIPELSLDVTPPEIAQQVYRVVYEITGNVDPYRNVKKQADDLAMSFYPLMKDRVDYSYDPLQTACKLAVAGNIMDLGAQPEYGDMNTIIEESLSCALNLDEYKLFKRSITDASLILYIGDNAGEIVFDQILIEQIQKINTHKIVYVVREKPIINDVTIDDAVRVGLDKEAKVISSGSDAPGTILNQCSSRMKQMYNSADVIIAKGQGNYESLCNKPGNIFFFFKVKCPVIARDSGYDIDTLVLIGNR
jgi:uncharacterized protein with ATP-grasp and redox domains